MRSWLRRRWGALLGFFAVAGLVLGGLGWVTWAALHLEQQRMEARAETEQANKLRLALWRLDSRMFTDLAREGSRPYHHFSAGEASTAGSTSMVELIPAPGSERPQWRRHDFIVALETEPKRLRFFLAQGLSMPSRKPAPAEETPQRSELLASLSHGLTLDKLAQVRLQNYLPPVTFDEQTMEIQPQAQQGTEQAFYGQGGNSQFPNPGQKIDRDTWLRLNRAAIEKEQGTYASKQELGKNVVVPGDIVPSAILGPLHPLWLSHGTLVAARLIQIGEQEVYHVTVLDWPQLQDGLGNEIRDLFPAARLQPANEWSSAAAHPDRLMTALPVQLDPGPSAKVEPGWTPLRLGLVIAWIAALVALVAVGLGGWTLLDLSERRIRFVSAVTHELRTPLTTLRLYLDMLTGGMVQDEGQKAEYLKTLNTESDRLNRLVGNVLDFSRLENQKPRLEITKVTVASVLEDLRSTWEERCHDAGKQLVIDNQAGGEALIQTDVKLVHQIISNLIDNACKYSRDAQDHRIWLRVRNGDAKQFAIEVEDRGPGVPAGERRAIFRAFRRGRSADVTAGGVGLGLALADRWARLLGGRLTLCSKSNVTGACFRLELPGVA